MKLVVFIAGRANDDALAVAVWVPPGSGEMGPWRMLQVGMGMLPFRLGLSPSLRLLKTLSVTEEFHKSVDGSHSYLAAVGVRSGLQGQGFGSPLVEIVGQADFDGHTITGMIRQPAARGDHHEPGTADREVGQRPG